jgi:hypothetical protein
MRAKRLLDGEKWLGRDAGTRVVVWWGWWTTTHGTFHFSGSLEGKLSERPVVENAWLHEVILADSFEVPTVGAFLLWSLMNRQRCMSRVPMSIVHISSLQTIPHTLHITHRTRRKESA